MLTDSLDVGCGEDYLGTVNVDLYPFDSTQGRYRWRKGFVRNLSNIPNLVKATVNMLPFKSNTIKTVYCRHLLEHEGVNLVQACKELLRVAKHQVIITTPSSLSSSRKSIGHNKILTCKAFHILFKKYKHTVKYTRFQLRTTLMPFKWLQPLMRLRKRFGFPLPFYSLPSPIPSEYHVTVKKDLKCIEKHLRIVHPEAFDKPCSSKGINVIIGFVNKILKLYQKTKFTRKLVGKARIKARTKRTVTSSRPIEYYWAIRHLNGKRILDVGSTGSLLPYQLARVGYDVYVIDLRDYMTWHGVPHPNLHVTVGNICDMPYPNNYFDTVTAISTLEHIGENKYNGQVGKHLERKAMQEIHRVTKPGGRLIMTVPTSCPVETGNPRTNYIKHYDYETLCGKLENYTILEHQIYPHIYSGGRSLTCVVAVKQS